METGDHTLKGFYGEKTMDEYKAVPSLMEERRRRKAKERRATLESIPELNQVGSATSGRGLENGERVDSGDASSGENKSGRMRRFSRVFARRSTVA